MEEAKEMKCFKIIIIKQFETIFFPSLRSLWPKASELFAETFQQMTQKLWTTKTRDLDKLFYILVFYNISFSWPLPLDGFQFIFLLRDSENNLLLFETAVAVAVEVS